MKFLIDDILSFQTGVTELYNEYVNKGVTPASTSLADMKNAVNSLYNEGTTTGKSLGAAVIIDYTWSGWTNGTAGTKVTKDLDITSVFPRYESITSSNIRVMMTTVGGTGGSNLNFYIDSYTPSTGILRIATTVNFKNPQLAIVIRP